jgi:thymidylate kinase
MTKIERSDNIVRMRIKASREAKHAKLLSFSGIDGAGKSTQIHSLLAALSQRGLRVRVIPFWDEIACLTRLRENTGHWVFNGDKGVGTPSAPVSRRDKNVRSWPMTCFRFCLYLLDALSVRSVIRRVSRSDTDIVVFDRYIYDELANLNLRNPINRTYVRMILKIVPEPDVCYLLDADPVEARARKPEYPVEFIHINRQSYKDLSELISRMAIVPPMSIDNVHRAILDLALKAFAGSNREWENTQNEAAIQSPDAQHTASSHPDVFRI